MLLLFCGNQYAYEKEEKGHPISIYTFQNQILSFRKLKIQVLNSSPPLRAPDLTANKINKYIITNQ